MRSPHFYSCLRNKDSSKAAWVIATFGIFILFSVAYLRVISYDDPTSAFFDASRAYQRRYTALRMQEAEDFISSSATANANGRATETGKQTPQVCIGIATVARRNHQYVRSTVGSLFEGLGRDERDMLVFTFFIAHTKPSEHPVYGESWLDHLPDRLPEYDPLSPDYDQVKLWEDGGWYRNKSIYDYRFLLEDCYSTQAQFIAIIEDDTLAIKGWFPHLLKALSVVRSRMTRDHQFGEWLYLRLFYADYLHGWNKKYWPTYLLWSFTFWVATTSATLAVKRHIPICSKHLTPGVSLAISVCCAPAIVALFFMAGKQTVLPMREGIQEMNKFGCCSQGLVYPREVIPRVLDHLKLETRGLVDMQLEKIADTSNLVRWATVPPLLQHIGGTSSKGYGFDDNAREIWSFRYERTAIV
jgi:hypothetical protein